MLKPKDDRPAIDEVLTLSWIKQYRYHIIRLFESYEYDQNKFLIEMQKLDNLKMTLSKHNYGCDLVPKRNEFKPKPKLSKNTRK